MRYYRGLIVSAVSGMILGAQSVWADPPEFDVSAVVTALGDKTALYGIALAMMGFLAVMWTVRRVKGFLGR